MRDHDRAFTVMAGLSSPANHALIVMAGLRPGIGPGIRAALWQRGTAIVDARIDVRA